MNEGRRRRHRPSLASRADPRDLYQRAVQSPSDIIDFCTGVYRQLRQRQPLRLREDFCGTAYLAIEWAKGHPRRRAIAIDIDPLALAWGREHNLGAAPPAVRRRVELIQSDVREVSRPRVDIACAMNFSFCVFKTRAELRRYLEAVFTGLAAGGIFVAELYGGTEAIIELEEEREVDDAFTYVWEQESFNPIRRETRCHIHFSFSDGSRLERAFTYDWRLWTIPEVRELLVEVGFAETRVYWEEVDEDGWGTGDYRLTEEEENQESWLVYLVGVKRPPPRPSA